MRRRFFPANNLLFLVAILMLFQMISTVMTHLAGMETLLPTQRHERRSARLPTPAIATRCVHATRMKLCIPIGIIRLAHGNGIMVYELIICCYHPRRLTALVRLVLTRTRADLKSHLTMCLYFLNSRQFNQKPFFLLFFLTTDENEGEEPLGHQIYQH